MNWAQVQHHTFDICSPRERFPPLLRHRNFAEILRFRCPEISRVALGEVRSDAASARAKVLSGWEHYPRISVFPSMFFSNTHLKKESLNKVSRVFSLSAKAQARVFPGHLLRTATTVFCTGKLDAFISADSQSCSRYDFFLVIAGLAASAVLALHHHSDPSYLE